MYYVIHTINIMGADDLVKSTSHLNSSEYQKLKQNKLIIACRKMDSSFSRKSLINAIESIPFQFATSQVRQFMLFSFGDILAPTTWPQLVYP